MQTLALIIDLIEAIEAHNASAQRATAVALAAVIGQQATAEILRALRVELVGPARVKAA